MPLASYAGPPMNHTAVMGALVGETIKAAFVDKEGRVWLVTPSGHAFTCSGFNSAAPAWSCEPPHVVQHAVETRRQELRDEINKIRELAPGIEI